MVKKRGKNQTNREDEDIELSGPSCRHIKKGTDQNVIKKLSGNEDWTKCQDCRTEDKKDNAPSQEAETEEGGTVWMCLKCGHRGCGRYSDNKHAIQHYETPRSDPHCLVVNLDNWAVWCYICDDEVHFSQTGHLAQLLTNLKKLSSTESEKRPSKKVKEEVTEVEQKLDALQLDKSEQQENKENQERPKKKEKRKESPAPSHPPSVTEEGRGVPVKGLSNLGNTCFFNAVIQNLSQTHVLRETLSKVIEEKITLDIQPAASSTLEPLTVHLERSGPLTLTMSQLLNEIQESKRNTVTPRDLFTQVCKKAARFKGFQQQDSQELLRYLLDGMRAEEIKRASSGLMESLKEAKKDGEELKTLLKEYEKNALPKNFVDQVFGGEMTSTVMCQQCNTVSVVKEMFLDLSLPVSDEAYRKKFQRKGTQKSGQVEDEGDGPALTNGNDDAPGSSKYQQKKAKKQAKKQAKQQKRQQKFEGKPTLDSLSSPESNNTHSDQQHGNDEEPTGEITEAKPEENDPSPTDARNQEEEEEEEEESTTKNRFTLLSEHQANTSTLDRTSDSIQDEENSTERDLDEAFLEDGEKVEDESMEGGEEETQESEEPQETEEPQEPEECTYTVVNQDPEAAFRTLAQRTSPEKQECSVQSCLFHFTEVETLTQNNSLLCVTCTKRQHSHKRPKDSQKVYTDALKQMLISAPPPVLTLHLKRFQQNGFSISKVNRHVQFPRVLDLAPFCAQNSQAAEEAAPRVLYALYGVVEHSGTMRSGHYTAYVKVRPKQSDQAQTNGNSAQGDTETVPGSWFHISDTSVQCVSESKVLNAQAYLLFYERIH